MGDLDIGWTVADPFPDDPLSAADVTAALDQAHAETTGWEDPDVARLGFAMSEPHPLANASWARFLALNSNNVGTHTGFGEGRAGTRRLEREAVLSLAGLLNADAADGHLTSGATEAMLQGLRIGRNSVRTDATAPVALITSEFAHHSVTKAAELLGLSTHVVPAGPSWVIEPEQLAQAIDDAIGDGATGIVVVLTAGYYNSGLCDPVDRLSALVRAEALRWHGRVRFFCFVDAAHGGLVFPFVDPELAFDFRNVGVHAMAVDPHKSGLLPYSCGTLLMRKGLLGHVTAVSPVTGIVDSTLGGSRPGAAAAALWAIVFGLGRAGLTAAMSACLARRDRLTAAIRAADPAAEIRPAPTSPVVAAAFSTTGGLLPPEFVDRYRLVPVMAPAADGRRRPHYHFYAGHSLTDGQVDSFGRRLAVAVAQARTPADRAAGEHAVPHQLRGPAAASNCFRYFVVHPPGFRDPALPGYDFHSFVSRQHAREPITVREWGVSPSGHRIDVYAPDLDRPFENELFGVRSDGWSAEVLDRPQQALSLVGAVHFRMSTGGESEHVLMNLESSGRFRSLEYVFGDGPFTDEVQCFADRVVVKLGKSARGVRRDPHDDAYSFSIDTSFECVLRFADDDSAPRLDRFRYYGDPLLPRRPHLLRHQYRRFPNRFFDVAVELTVGRAHTRTWHLSDLVEPAARDALVARSGLVGLCRPELTGAADAVITVSATSLAGERSLRLTVDPRVGERMTDCLPILDVREPERLRVDDVVRFAETATGLAASQAAVVHSPGSGPLLDARVGALT